MKSTTPLPLQQHRHFAAALALMGRQTRTIDLPGAAPLRAVAQFGQLMASRGPIWHTGMTPQAQTDALRQSGLRLLNADQPETDVCAQAGYRMITTAAYVAELDLTGTTTDRINRAKGKWRNAWRRSLETEITVTQERFQTAKHQWLLNADREQQRQKRFRSLPHSLISAYAASHPKDVVVLTAMEGNTPIAAMLFLLHHPVATYHLGWTSARGRSLAAHHRLIMHAADAFAARGITRLDLGTVDTETAPGLARFKIGTGAQIRALGGTWLRVPGLSRWPQRVSGAKPRGT
jgi:hypothetical protein